MSVLKNNPKKGDVKIMKTNGFFRKSIAAKKEKTKGFVMGVMVTVLLMSTVTVFANSISRTITVTYNNIRLVVNGEEVIPRDGAGNIVEPFIYEGTTFLPVRAVANALGQDVGWDAETQTVFIGSGSAASQQPTPQNDDVRLLSQIQHSNFSTGGGREFYLIDNGGSITSHLDVIYNNGIIIRTAASTGSSTAESDTWGISANAHVQYEMQGQYRTLTGTAVRPKAVDVIGNRNTNMSTNGSHTVVFIGDGRELTRVNNVTPSAPLDFSVDVNGVQTLQISVIQHGAGGQYISLALTDLRLYN